MGFAASVLGECSIVSLWAVKSVGPLSWRILYRMTLQHDWCAFASGCCRPAQFFFKHRCAEYFPLRWWVNVGDLFNSMPSNVSSKTMRMMTSRQGFCSTRDLRDSDYMTKRLDMCSGCTCGCDCPPGALLLFLSVLWLWPYTRVRQPGQRAHMKTANFTKD